MPINISNYLNRFEKLKLQIGKDFDQINFIHPSVKCVSLDVDTTVYDGLRYIVGDPDPTNPTSSDYGTGDFASCPKNYIAEYDSRLKSWTFFKPYVGMEVIDRDSRYLKMYNGSTWANVMNFSVVSEGVNGNAALADEAVKLSSVRTFSVAGAVEGSNTSDLTSGVSIPTTLNLTSNSAISGILPIEKGGTENNEGKAKGLDHDFIIKFNNGIISDSENQGSNLMENGPNGETLYEIDVTGIDASYININELSKLHGGTGRNDGLVPGLDHNVSFSLTGGVIGSKSSNLNGDSVSIDTRLQLSSMKIDGILPIYYGGTGNASGYAAALDHPSKFVISGKVTGESDENYIFEKQDDWPDGITRLIINVSKINLGTNDTTGVTGILSTTNGGTGNSTGSAESAKKLDHGISFSLTRKVEGSSSSNNLNSNSISIDVSKINLGNNDTTGVSGILSTTNGGTGNSNGRAQSAIISDTATKLLKYFKIDLKSGSTNLASTNYFNGETSTSSLPSNSQTLTLNLQTTLPMNIHPDPETSGGTGPYSRVYIDSKGHVRSGTYSKKISFKTIPYSFDIFKGDNFIYKFTQNSAGIQHFGDNPGYMSFYTKPFTVFNDSNIYKDTTINISLNVIFNGLFYYESGDAEREWIHYLDVLLFNEPINNSYFSGALNVSNGLVNDDNNNNYYLKLITGNNNSATSSVFLNNCYHLIGVENSTLTSCGMNLYDRLQNYYVNIYGNEIGVSFYSSVFNYSKSISLTNFISPLDGSSKTVDFSKTVYGIFKISTRCRNMLPATYNKNIARVFSTSDDSSVSYHPYYYPAHDYMYIDRPSTLKLSSPRIDFEYNSY